MNDETFDRQFPLNFFGEFELDETRDVVANICRLPMDLKTRMYSKTDLIQRSGVISEPQAINTSNISKHLREHDELIDAWLTLSGDQRTSSGWYFYREEDGQWVVGYFPESGRIEDGERLFYSDPIDACANFIIRYINRTPGIISPQHKP